MGNIWPHTQAHSHSTVMVKKLTEIGNISPHIRPIPIPLILQLSSSYGNIYRGIFPTHLKFCGKPGGHLVEELVSWFVGAHEDQLHTALPSKKQTNRMSTNTVRSLQFP